MREVTSTTCAWCAQPFDYVRVTKRRTFCSHRCANASFTHRENDTLQAIRSGTLNPRPSLQACNSVASCSAVLVPPSQIPANDFAWTIEPPLPKQSWVFEVSDQRFNRLAQAEAYASHWPGVLIYCKPAEAEQKAVNQ